MFSFSVLNLLFLTSPEDTCGCGHCRSCLGISSSWELLEPGNLPCAWGCPGDFNIHICVLHCSRGTAAQAGDYTESQSLWYLVVSASKQLWVSHLPVYSSLLSQTSSCKTLLSAASLLPSPISVVPPCMIEWIQYAVNSNFHVTCLFFTHEMNVCNFRFFLTMFLACVFGKADIVPKASQIICSLWLVYCFIFFVTCFTKVILTKTYFYWNKFLLERWKFIISLLFSVSGSFISGQ